MPGAETFRASADVYDRHVGRYGAQLASALITFAGVEPGMRALDVGCGPGALTATLVQRLGPENVCGADPSETFVQACRARLPGVAVAVAGAGVGDLCAQAVLTDRNCGIRSNDIYMPVEQADRGAGRALRQER